MDLDVCFEPFSHLDLDLADINIEFVFNLSLCLTLTALFDVVF